MGKPVVTGNYYRNPAKRSEFYEKVFDWKIQHIPEMNYRLVETGGPGWTASTAAKHGQRSKRWFAKLSPREALLTMSRKTMVLCMAMDFRIWMVTFGSSSIWSQAP